MEEVGYVDLAAHKQQHADFLSRLRVLQERLAHDDATPEDRRVLADTVEAWMKDHLLDQDRRLVEFIRSQAPEPPDEPRGSASSRSPGPGWPPPRLHVV